MILNKIQEEVERLIGPGCEDRKVSPPLSSELPYLFPRVDNNNDVDSSRKSLKSLEELSKCAPLPLFKRIQKDVRSRNDEPLINRSDPCVKYLLPSSTTPESTVSAIQSLEKLSAEHPVLRRIEPPQAVTASPLRPTSADKVQYLPPSFGGEASNANSIQSLERFSSEHSFFGYCLTKPHSKPTNTCCNISMSEKPAQHAHATTRSLQNGMVSQHTASPLVVTLPKLEPLSPVESRTEEDGDHIIRPKMKTEDQESEEVDHSHTQGSRRHHESDKESSSQQLISNSSTDPLLALNNLVRKKQGIVASPSPSKVAWELVNKDMKPPLYILPPDDIKNQADKNPLEEIDKMLKFS
ncbi:hypothetical protein BSL78_05747 [Apostichopus japonicus]|uniref:Uncharacterized protein n=2 Tax=Stichopus japonicus TaxID=307972 RepID=A0A2G8LAQ9_STIJA|nr:hypothetical protein BSL78_05747 [Apostichopus japonicus]